MDDREAQPSGACALKGKKPWLAFLLSFLLPGAGLAYLGRWGLAALNLVVVLSIGVILALCLPEEQFDKWISPIAAGLGAGSGGFAKALALGLIPSLEKGRMKANP